LFNLWGSCEYLWINTHFCFFAEIHHSCCAQRRTLDSLREWVIILWIQKYYSIKRDFVFYWIIGSHKAWHEPYGNTAERMVYSEKIRLWILFLLVALLGISAPGPTSTRKNDYLSDKILQDTCFRNYRCSLYSVGSKRTRFSSKSVTTNEPPLGCHHFLPLGGHHLLPSWLLRSQVCTPAQCIEPISVCVSKKWREKEEICLKKCHNEWAPSRMSSPLSCVAALQPSLYTYSVYRTHLCKCFQKVARKGGDFP